MHLNIHIQGKVQGVWFRKSTKDKADELGLKGFVKNQKDGSVYAEAEGNKADLETFLKWCALGPRNAKVSKVSSDKGEMRHFQSFEIRR